MRSSQAEHAVSFAEVLTALGDRLLIILVGGVLDTRNHQVWVGFAEKIANLCEEFTGKIFIRGRVIGLSKIGPALRRCTASAP